jgi:hypothetical protein
MDAVSLRSSMDAGELRLGPVRYRGDAAWYRASLSGPVVNGAVEVRDRVPVPLARFLCDLGEKKGSGAIGEAHYTSLEGQLELSGTRDPLGHVFLKVVLREGRGGPEWMVSGILQLEAGQLAEIARAAEGLFGAAPPDHAIIRTWPARQSG